MIVVPIDWNVFEYKFSANTRQAFESLAYMLFCFELKQEYGVFRYFNQPYIETQPVDTGDGYVTGFQAKYYDASTCLSSKESDLKNTIISAKTKYQGINRIFLYINKELSSSGNKDEEKPSYQKNIEQCGKDHGIEIEWRVRSNFEKMLLSNELSVLRDLYFNPKPDIYKFAKAIQTRSIAILNNIKSNINYQQQEIKLENAKEKLVEFVDSNNSAFVIYGDAGTGKSGLVKDFVLDEFKEDNSVLVMFAASDVDVDEEVFFLKKYGEYSLDELFALYKNAERKICILDAAEKYVTFKCLDVFKNIINKFIDDGWKIIITIRTVYKDGFCNLFFEKENYTDFRVQRIDEEELVSLSESYNFILPQDPKMRDLLCNLFYLKMYLSLNNVSELDAMNVKLFAECIWKQVVRNEANKYNDMPARREKFVQDMVLDMLRKESYTYHATVSDDYEARCSLEDSGLVAPYNASDDLWVMSHDVYEELIVKHILSKRYNENISTAETLDGFGSSLRSRKMFRVWLESELDDCDGKCIDFLMGLLGDGKLEQSWKDEALIALMNSENEQAFRTLEMMLSQDEFKLFTRTVFLLNTACRNINLEIFKVLEESGANRYRFTKPVGKAWGTIFRYIYNNRSLIPWTVKNLTVVSDAVKSWASNFEVGDTTKLAGLIAIYLKGRVWSESNYQYSLYKDDLYSNISDAILMSALEIKGELSKIIDDIISEGSFSHRTENYNVLEKIVSNVFECGRAHKAIPLKVLELVQTYWMFQDDRYYMSSLNMEDHFGVNRHREYYPESAYQTPMYLLLRVAPKESIDCIIGIMNYATDCYKKSRLAIEYKECHDVEVVFNDTERVKQVCSDRLWKLHRGTSVAPDLLESILMALEKWLLDVIPEMSEGVATSYCLYLLKKSNNVAITSLVVSLIIAYPDKLFKVACVLLKTKDIFHYDIARCVSEQSANFMKGMPGERHKFDVERIESNNLEFRKNKLEDIIINYQIQRGKLSQEEFVCRCKILYDTIDNVTEDIDTWNPDDRFAYYRMDLRKYKEQGNISIKDGIQCIELKPEIPEELVELSNTYQAEREQLFKHVELSVWSYNRYAGDTEGYKKYSKYEDEPTVAFKEMMQILGSEGEELGLTDMSAVVYTCAILLRDFKSCLDEEQLNICGQIVLEIAYDIVEKNIIRQAGDGTEAIIPELVNMSYDVEAKAEWDNPIFLLLAIAMNYGQEREKALESISKNLWRVNRKAATKLLCAYIDIVSQYSECVERYGGVSPIVFFDNNRAKIEVIFAEESYSLNSINVSELKFKEVLVLNLMLDREDNEIHNLVINLGKHIWEKIFGKDHDRSNDSRDYRLEYEYLEWLADYVLNQSEVTQTELLQELIPLVRFDREFGTWLHNIISQQDRTPREKAFWNFWNLLQNYVFVSCDTNKDYYSNPKNEISIGYGFNEMLVNFLFACTTWRDGIIEWHTLKKENAIFFKMVSNRIGYNAATLYSLARVLNTVGKDTFFYEGIEWISTIVNNNIHLQEGNLPTNTLYYIEEYIYQYIRREQSYFRDNSEMKKKIFSVLDFLVNRGSTVGFLLREEIV